MKKHIDADRLRAVIKRQIRLEELNFASLGGGGQTFCTNTLEWVLKQIDSLQQEPTTDTDVLHTELVNLLKTYSIGEETARTMADRIADTYGAQRYTDGLCDGLNEEDTKKEQEQSESSKGKFVFPNFLYARTEDNKTIDVSYAPQSLDSVEYIRNDSLQQERDSVAERFARIVRGNLIGIDKGVQHKFEQLYFEVTGNKMYGGYND